jgi:hypothetical protein
VTLVETYCSGKVKVSERRGVVIFALVLYWRHICPRCCNGVTFAPVLSLFGRTMTSPVKKTNKSGQRLRVRGLS